MRKSHAGQKYAQDLPEEDQNMRLHLWVEGEALMRLAMYPDCMDKELLCTLNRVPVTDILAGGLSIEHLHVHDCRKCGQPMVTVFLDLDEMPPDNWLGKQCVYCFPRTRAYPISR